MEIFSKRSSTKYEKIILQFNMPDLKKIFLKFNMPDLICIYVPLAYGHFRGHMTPYFLLSANFYERFNVLTVHIIMI